VNKYTILVRNQPPRSIQPDYFFVGRYSEYSQHLGSKRAHCAVH